MKRKKGLKNWAVVIITAAVLTCVWYILREAGFFLPRWISWENRTVCDGSGNYEIRLDEKTVSVFYGDFSGRGKDSEVLSDSTVSIWRSPENVKVQDILSADIDNDGEDELVLLCWKKGRYGRQKPFWVKKDETDWSQHIFVYEYDGGEIRAKWMSSYIGQDVAEISVNDREAPDVRLLLTGPDRKTSCWRWDVWGFTKENADVSFVVFGDVLLHEPIYRYGLSHGRSFDFLFENVKEIIAESDISVINQETPLTDNPALYSDYPKFGTPAEMGDAIAAAGFDAVTCATNHALDKGVTGIRTTKEVFNAAQVLCLGIQSEEETEYLPYEIIERKNIRFALLNYTYGTNGLKVPEENPYMVHLLKDEAEMAEDIKKARSEADFVIVFVHWGTENTAEVDDFQKRWTQVFLENGVDAVVGTHPHALQKYELLKDENGHEMLIYYSIGNFISAQQEKSCVKGGIAAFTVSPAPDGYRVTDYSLRPLTISRKEGGRYSVAPGDLSE